LPICEGCQAGLPWITRQAGNAVAAPLRYTDRVRLAMHRYKYNGYALYDRTLGLLVTQAARDAGFSEIDLCTFVPGSRLRARNRGYDQAKRLCKATAAELGAPWGRCLRKRRDTRSQVEMKDDAARRDNVRGAFAVTDGVAGKRILLIDDVCTTGATLSECRETLLSAGAAEVFCAVAALARADK